MSDSPLSLALRLRWKTGHTGCVVGSDPASLLHTTESDHRVPDRYEVDEQVRRLLAREQALAEVAEIKAVAQAEEWFGISGDVFDPDTPEPMPCVLLYAPGRFAFAPGVIFLFGPRSTLKTWLGYVAVVQEVKRGNRADRGLRVVLRGVDAAFARPRSVAGGAQQGDLCPPDRAADC